jgi:phosphonate transport system substrate-binding protein
MLKINFFLLFIFSNFLFPKDTLVFAPLPFVNKKIVFNDFYPMINYLEKKLNKKIIFFYSDNYDDVLKNFKDSKIDLVYLGPLPYIELKNEYDSAQLLINFKNSDNTSTYSCSLVKFINNKKTQKVALTQPLSTCGYFSVNSLLNNKLENYDYKYLGKHDNVALSIIREEFDIGGVKTSIFKDYYHLGLEEISRTNKFPGMALIGNEKTLDKEYLNEIKQILLTTKKVDYSLWGEEIRYGLGEAFDKDYDEIRGMLKNLTIPKKDKYINE